jgi:hypothetical protein
VNIQTPISSGILCVTLTALAFALCACSDSEVAGSKEVVESGESKQTFVFQCGDEVRFTARLSPVDAWVFLSEATINLSAVPGDGVKKYNGESYTLVVSGEESTLEREGREILRCQNDRAAAIWEHAKLNGADFRAVGNEPGWNLEILAGSRIVLVSDYGATRIE